MAFERFLQLSLVGESLILQKAHLLSDPRNQSERLIPGLFHESHSIGIGMMPRVINPSTAIEQIQHRNFGPESLIVQFEIIDDFLDKMYHVTVAFDKGSCELSSKHADVTIRIDIANYSSLLFGAVSFKSLHNYGLITLSNSSYADKLITLFKWNEKPICTLSF
jgi:predicted acetyltransferase